MREARTSFACSLVLLGLLAGGRADGGAPAASPASPSSLFVGQELSEALLALQARGLTLLFTSQVVRADMRVIAEPQAAEPRAILDELLAPHGLRASEEAGGVLVIVPSVNGRRPPALPTGTIVVEVRSTDALETVGSATLVAIAPPGREAECAIDGRCVLPALAPGSYDLEVRARGFVTGELADITVSAGRTARVTIALTPEPFIHDEIVIQASQLSLLSAEPAAPLAIGRTEMDRVPHLGGDLFRALSLLPGISANDVTARFSIHGGRRDEVEVLLDGQELYDAFHLKDYDGALSVVPARNLGGANLITGAMEASYGDRMGGVLDLTTLRPSRLRQASFSLSSVDALLQGSGLLPNDRGNWLASARRGFLDLAGKAVGSENPVFWDLFGKLELRFGDRNSLWLRTLAASDALDFQESVDGGDKRFRNDYDDRYAWLRHQAILGRRLMVESGLSWATIERDRNGLEDDEKGRFSVADRRRITIAAISQEWSLQQGPAHLLRGGWQLRRHHADFEYANRLDPEIVIVGSWTAARAGLNRFHGSLESRQTEAWIADRFALRDALTLELGLRYDGHSLPAESRTSPRASIAWSPSQQSVLRASWGQLEQSQRPYELQVEDGLTALAPAERAEHWVVGWEQRFAESHAWPRVLRVEYFRRHIANPRVRFENALEQINTLPEAEPDRIRLAPESSFAAGVELVLRGSLARSLDWWLIYSHSRAEDRIAGESSASKFDQPDALSLNLNIPLGKHWNLNLAWRAHTGWPTTPVIAAPVEDEGEVVLVPAFGAWNSERLRTYHRLDLRASRTWRVKGGELVFFCDIQNAYDRRNIAGYDVTVGDERGNLLLQEEHGPGIFPSIGISWGF